MSSKIVQASISIMSNLGTDDDLIQTLSCIFADSIRSIFGPLIINKAIPFSQKLEYI